MHHRSGTRYVRKKDSPWSIMFFRKGTDFKVELKGHRLHVFSSENEFAGKNETQASMSASMCFSLQYGSSI